ncbi:TetR family transcriptional regulator [Labedella gwakjiensis]|uniref:TetR family transcriptional regulator n=1 Tax=Labedella gwakjiensis TaxID=390269 RepID=A0A2P8GZG5_9MICO|nr:TetR/AcrR family transcriptional regulator [Labedella gwakjiensis]PSL39348.1 TetR family transcriptional regulator [Labedella gwakjiensis]
MDESPSRPESSARRRILDAASSLFYTLGVRSVSADRVISESAVSKVTFYRHFPTKDDLVLAYVEETASAERAQYEEARSRLDDAALWGWYVASVVDAGCLPGFRGCPFINAAVEYPEATHVVRLAVARHREWVQGELEALATRLGAVDPRCAAQEIYMLRDGALVLAALDGASERIAPVLDEAGRRLLSV